MTEIGDLTSLGTIQETDRVYKAEGSKTINYVVSEANEATFLAGYNIGTSTSDGLLLTDIKVRKGKGVSRVALSYNPETVAIRRGVVPSGGTVQKSSSSAVDSRSIWAHPGIDNPKGYLNDEVPKFGGVEYPGTDSYFTPSATYTREEVVSSFSFTGTDVKGDVGTVEDPNGLTSPGTRQWIKVSNDVNQSGETYTKTETWQHAGFSAGTSNSWPADIYG